MTSVNYLGRIQQVEIRTQATIKTTDRNVEYKRPAGAYPLRDFHKIRSLYLLSGALGAIRSCYTYTASGKQSSNERRHPSLMPPLYVLSFDI